MSILLQPFIFPKIQKFDTDPRPLRPAPARPPPRRRAHYQVARHATGAAGPDRAVRPTGKVMIFCICVWCCVCIYGMVIFLIFFVLLKKKIQHTYESTLLNGRHIYRHIEQQQSSSSSSSSSFFPLTKARTDARALAWAGEMEGKGWLAAAAAAAATATAAAASGDGGGGKGGGGGGGADSSSSCSCYHPFPLSPPEFVFALMPWRHAPPTVERCVALLVVEVMFERE